MSRFDWQFLLTIVLAVGLVLAASYFGARAECVSRVEVMGVEYQWGLFKGCMIKVDNQWIPLGNYRKIEE